MSSARKFFGPCSSDWDHSLGCIQQVAEPGWGWLSDNMMCLHVASFCPNTSLLLDHLHVICASCSLLVSGESHLSVRLAFQSEEMEASCSFQDEAQHWHDVISIIFCWLTKQSQSQPDSRGMGDRLHFSVREWHAHTGHGIISGKHLWEQAATL